MKNETSNIDNDFQVEEDMSVEEKLKKLREKLKKCQKEKEEYLGGWQRSKADYINTRKKEEEERKNFIKMSNEALLSDILPVLDSFDLAIESQAKEKKENKTAKGLRMINLQIKNVLKRYGLENIIITDDEKFNPELHEAIKEEESKKESGIIIEEIQKGYKLNNKILRPTKVIIAK